MERRRQTRRPFDQIIEVTFVSVPGGDPMQGRTVLCKAADLSADGIRLVVDRPLPADAVVTLSIRVQGSPETHVLRGVVRWSGEPARGKIHDVGIAFAAHEKAGAEAWRQFVTDLAGG